ncbi:MAG: phosphoglycolate phosphatase [Burkholderiales bacterium]|nr:phosphoglycolate phosphatase [Burkholderiales bacterium]
MGSREPSLAGPRLAVRALLIDLDGTLLESGPDLARAMNRTLAEQGLAELDLPQVVSFIGRGLGHLLAQSLRVALQREPSQAEIDALLPRFEAHYEGLLGFDSPPYPGVVEGLGALQKAGFALACVTNKHERFTLPLLDKTGLARFFELVVSGDTCARKKPHPDMLLHACSHFGVAPAEALMVGDSSNDVEAARAAGCPVWCLPYGYNEGGPGVPLAADRIIASFVELPALLVLAGRAGAARTTSADTALPDEAPA